MKIRLCLTTLALLVLAGLLISGCGQKATHRSVVGLNKCKPGQQKTSQDIFNCVAENTTKSLRQNPSPTTVIPSLEKTIRGGGGPALASCRVAMYQSGMIFAKEHGVTVDNINDYMPPAIDGQCQAGFAQGLIAESGIKANMSRLATAKLLGICKQQTSKARQQACLVGIGHGLRRQGEQSISVRKALAACRRLGRPIDQECALGVYNDLFFAINGLTGTKRQFLASGQNENFPLATSYCARQPAAYNRQCWYRYFLGGGYKGLKKLSNQTVDITTLCLDVKQPQKNGCITGAATAVFPLQFLARECSALRGGEAVACLSGGDLPYPLAPLDSKTTHSWTKAKLRSYINNCLDLVGAKEQQACVYWTAFRTVNETTTINSAEEITPICSSLRSTLDNSLYRNCHQGINDALARVANRSSLENPRN